MGFLVKTGFGVRLKNKQNKQKQNQTTKPKTNHNTIGSKYIQYPPEMGQKWRQPLVNQVSLNWQNPNQGCATVPGKWGPSLHPVSHKGHSSL